jgi:hypothetical protein
MFSGSRIAGAAAGLVAGVAIGLSGAAGASPAQNARACSLQSLAAGVTRHVADGHQTFAQWQETHKADGAEHTLAEVVRDTLDCENGGWGTRGQYNWIDSLGKTMPKGMPFWADRYGTG